MATDDRRIDDYQPPQLNIVCRRCDRQATARTHALKARYGNPTLSEVAFMVAADGNPPCNLAAVEGNALFGARPEEPSVEQWATLLHARTAGWTAWLKCQRRHAAMKAAKSITWDTTPAEPPPDRSFRQRQAGGGGLRVIRGEV